MGSSRSRDRVFMEMVASSVPSAQMPMSASSSTTRNGSRSPTKLRSMKKSANTGTATAWMISRKTRLPAVLAKKMVTRSTGQSSRPSRQRSSFSCANERLSPSSMAKMNVTHSMPPVKYVRSAAPFTVNA